MTEFKKTAKQIEATYLLSSPARHIMLYGGSRSGKTAISIYAILVRAMKAPKSRHAIVRFRFNHVKQSIWYDTLPKIAGLAFPDLKIKENKSDWFMTLPNGSEIWFCGLDDKERVEKILGNEYSTIYFNESSQLSYDAVQVALTRLAQKTCLKPKAYYDCNPPGKRHWTYSMFIKNENPISKEALKSEHYASMLMNPKDNEQNLSDGYVDTMLAGLTQRQRRRFELGEWLDDVDGALWKTELIDKTRVSDIPKLRNIVVSIDPATTTNKDSDETGIVVIGIDNNDEGYVLDDLSGKYTPSEWAKIAVSAWKDWKADVIVAEKNQGGDMVMHTLQTEMINCPVKLVHASKGKMARAEPIVALYEQNRVHHVGTFDMLEDQMVSWKPHESTSSPDRIDAMVWGATYLMLDVKIPMIMQL